MEEYVTGGRYRSDSEMVAVDASAFAVTVNGSGDGMDAWVFDIDETLLCNVPYYAAHGFGSEKCNERWKREKGEKCNGQFGSFNRTKEIYCVALTSSEGGYYSRLSHTSPCLIMMDSSVKEEDEDDKDMEMCMSCEHRISDLPDCEVLNLTKEFSSTMNRGHRNNTSPLKKHGLGMKKQTGKTLRLL